VFVKVSGRLLKAVVGTTPLLVLNPRLLMVCPAAGVAARAAAARRMIERRSFMWAFEFAGVSRITTL
jgi:hypothetical protein